MPLTLRRAAALLLGALYLPLVAAADNQPTHEFFLDNGLKVIVREDHRAPVVVSQLWYKVGSSYETAGQTGLSHALEHMMFKGSRKLDAGEASRILRELGAEENAFTSDDYTAYYQVLARDRLAVAFELEADRLASLKLPPEEFAREIEVIKEERRLRTDDKPSSLAYERFKTIAYPASGYRNPTIGWMDDLNRMQADELRAWYEQWYAPNNATLVVVGDVTADEVRGLAERFFGGIERREVPTAKRPLELDEPGERRLRLHVRTQLPTLLMAFNAPSLATEENARQVHALRLISALLDGGYSARLPERLERGEELVTSASAWYDGYAVATLGGRTRARACPGHRRAGVRARFHHPAGHHHRQAGNRRPVLAADGRGAGGARGRHARRHPAGCAQLFHPLAPERRPCSARGSPR